MIKKDSKSTSISNQSKPDRNKNKIIQQDQDDLKLKLMKIERQVASLNMNINSLLQERNLKQNVQKILLKQRRNLENCFLFKRAQTTRQVNNDSKENSDKESLRYVNSAIKNRFRDVNERIAQYTQFLQTIRSNGQSSKPEAEEAQDNTFLPSPKLQCQSLHLKQIFNPQHSNTHQTKVINFKEKLSLLYEKIHLSLQSQQPYLHQKILSRIKRQAQKQSKQRLLTETQKLIKQNSCWITQQTNQLNNQLEEKEIETICVNNLGLMKRIMGKKIQNNDFIYENYVVGEGRKYSSVQGVDIVGKVKEMYCEMMKCVEEGRIHAQLTMLNNDRAQEMMKQSQKDSLTYILKQPTFERLLTHENSTRNVFQAQEEGLLQKMRVLHEEIQGMIKK